MDMYKKQIVKTKAKKVGVRYLWVEFVPALGKYACPKCLGTAKFEGEVCKCCNGKRLKSKRAMVHLLNGGNHKGNGKRILKDNFKFIRK